MYHRMTRLSVFAAALTVFTTSLPARAATKIHAYDPMGGDLFGYSVAISGGTAIVGAFWRDGDEPGEYDLGAAYLFDTAGTALLGEPLTAADGEAFDNFGLCVAVSGDVHGDIIIGGKTALMFTNGFMSLLFWIEIALFVVPMIMFAGKKARDNFRTLFNGAFLLMLAGSVYRFNAYIVAYNPGENWSYFPTVLELLITLGVIAFEVFLYIVIVKRYPILSGTRAATVPAFEGRA